MTPQPGRVTPTCASTGCFPFFGFGLDPFFQIMTNDITVFFTLFYCSFFPGDEHPPFPRVAPDPFPPLYIMPTALCCSVLFPGVFLFTNQTLVGLSSFFHFFFWITAPGFLTKFHGTWLNLPSQWFWFLASLDRFLTPLGFPLLYYSVVFSRCAVPPHGRAVHTLLFSFPIPSSIYPQNHPIVAFSH